MRPSLLIATSIIFYSLVASAEGQPNFSTVAQSCNPKSDGAKCLLEKGLSRSNCTTDDTFIDCESPPNEIFSKETMASNCIPQFYANPTRLEFELVLKPKKDAKGNICSYQGYEVEALNGYEVRIPVGHAVKQKDGKWSAAPPVIPIGLRSLVKPNEIIVTQIKDRQRFGFMLGQLFIAQHQPKEPINFYSYFGDSYSETETETYVDNNGITRDRRKKFADSKKIEVLKKLIKHFGLDESNDFLRQDRSAIGRSKELNYSVITEFKPKKALKICGRTIAKGTKISVSGLGDYAIDGIVALYIDPQIPTWSEESPNVAKALFCLPQATKSTEFTKIFWDQMENPNKPLPPVPKLDYQNCDCQMRDFTMEWLKD